MNAAIPRLLRFRPTLLIVMSLCLLFAEHHSVLDMHGGVIDRDYISAERSGQLPRQIAYLVLGAIGATGVWEARRRKRLPLAWDRGVVGSMGLLLGWCALSITWSDTPAISCKRLAVVGLMLLGAAGVALWWTQRQILAFIAISAALQVCGGIASEVAYGFFTPWQSDYRFGGTLPWNQQGYLCMVLLLASLCLFGRSRPGQAVWGFRALVVFGAVFMLLTRSRGSLIGLAVALGLYALLVLKPVGKVVMVVVAGTLLSVMLLTGVADKAMDLLNRGGEGAENLTGRAPLWEELLTYVHQRPLLGYGYEGFWNDHTIDDISGHQHWSIDASHSSYLESTLTLGIVGAVLHGLALLVAAVESIRRFLRTRRLVYYLCAALCLIYLVGGYLEAILLVKPSPISFFLSMLLFSTAMFKQTAPKAASSTRTLYVQFFAEGLHG